MRNEHTDAMSVSTLIQLIAACVGIVGSVFFAIGVMRQSVEAMAALSGTYWGWNPNMPPALAAQKADYFFGGGLIVLAFAFQLASFFVPSTPALSESQGLVAPWLAAVVTLLVFLLLRLAARFLARHFESQIVEWLKLKSEKSKATPT
jgi:hypothetical protein